MKKLILIIAALMLMSCCGESTSSQNTYYKDSVIVYNTNGDVLRSYDNVKVSTAAEAEKVYVYTSDGQRLCLVGGIMVVKYGR